MNAIKYGYNIANGGEGGDTITNHPNRIEISRKHSDWALENSNWKKGMQRTKEDIENWKVLIGDKMKGENNPNFGKKMSEESKNKISESNKGREVSLETRNKISESNRGKVSKKKGIPNPSHSKWMKENNPFSGKTHTDEVKKILSELGKRPKGEGTKSKISESLKIFFSDNKPLNTKKIHIDGLIYLGYNDASKSTGVPVSTIRNRIKSKNYTEYYHL